MLVFLTLLLLMQDKVLFIGSPKVVSPGGSVDDKGVVTLKNDSLIARVEAMDPQQIMAHVKAAGVSPEIYEDEKVKLAFSSMLAFRIEIENPATDTLTFNPDHVVLTTHKDIPVGTHVRVADYWPTTEPLGDANWEKFAELFSRVSSDIPPGAKISQLLVFRPIRKPFEGKLHLQLDRIYAGVRTNRVVCQFEAGYSKE